MGAGRNRHRPRQYLKGQRWQCETAGEVVDVFADVRIKREPPGRGGVCRKFFFGGVVFTFLQVVVEQCRELEISGGYVLCLVFGIAFLDVVVCRLVLNAQVARNPHHKC
ncbi:Uncharacterised protein [Mycobacterium tuberculosis]|nr:Uncharacterised protein [Mycobacterium tuberculosis]